MPYIRSVIRYAWAAPTTVLGLVVVAMGLRRTRLRVVDGVLEAYGPALAWLLSHLTLLPGGAAALTLGHVVIARDRASLETTRAHERVHVRQCESWGPLFVPAYLAASLLAVLRGRDFYFGNRFEVEAFHDCAHSGLIRGSADRSPSLPSPGGALPDGYHLDFESPTDAPEETL